MCLFIDIILYYIDCVNIKKQYVVRSLSMFYIDYEHKNPPKLIGGVIFEIIMGISF